MILSPVSYITDNQIQPNEPTYRFFAELASNELDFEGVPMRFVICDIAVSLPCEACVRQLLDDKGLLEEWGITSIWVPDDLDSPF